MISVGCDEVVGVVFALVWDWQGFLWTGSPVISFNGIFTMALGGVTSNSGKFESSDCGDRPGGSADQMLFLLEALLFH